MAPVKKTDHLKIIQQLKRHQGLFEAMLSGVEEEMYQWRPAPDKWCLLEILCHLYDEECEDFRDRVKSVLNDPEQPLTPIDPVGWVEARKYMEQDYELILAKWVKARGASIQWLEGLQQPFWENTFQHRTLGPMSAELFLANWLAHDYLHIRQINRLKYAWLEENLSISDLSYAGNW